MKEIDITGIDSTEIIKVTEADCIITGKLSGTVNIKAGQFSTLDKVTIENGVLRVCADMITIGGIDAIEENTGKLQLVSKSIICPKLKYPNIKTVVTLALRGRLCDSEKISLKDCATSIIELDQFDTPQIRSTVPIKIKK